MATSRKGEARVKLVAETGQFVRDTKKAEQTFLGLEKSFIKGTLAAAGLTFGVKEAGRALLEMSERGSRVIGVRESFQALGKDYDAILKASRNATRGMVSDFELMQVANKGILLGLPITAKEMAVLGKTAIALGRAMDVGPGQAMQDLITGLGRGSPAILDNLGITVKAQDAYKEYAAQIGTSANALTGAQKKLAVYKTALTAATTVTDQMGRSSDTTSQGVSQMTAAWTNMTDAFSEVLASMPAAIGMFGDLAVVLNRGAEGIQSGAKGLQLWALGVAKITGILDASKGFHALRLLMDRGMPSVTQDTSFGAEPPSIGTPSPDYLAGILDDGLKDELKEVNKELAEQAKLTDTLDKLERDLVAGLREQLAAETALMRVHEDMDSGAFYEDLNVALGGTKATAESMFGEVVAGFEEAGKEADQMAAGMEEIEEVTINWHQALQDAANQMALLGGAGKALSQIMGGISGIGAGLDLFKQGQKAGGLGGFFAQVSGIGGIAGAAVGIGKAIVGLFRSDPVESAQKEAGKYLGMNISNELAEQFVKQAEQTGQSIEAVAQQWFDDMKQALRDEGMSMAMEGLNAQVAALGDAPQYAEVAARNFNTVFWETVKDQGLPAALEAFKDIYANLRAAFGDELPPGFGGLAKLFGLMEDPAIAAQLQFAQGQASFVGGATQAGFYDPSMTQDSINIATDTLGALREQGVTDQQGYQMISGLLQAELNAAIASGRQIDARLQGLLDEARANGVQVLPGIAEQQLDVLKKIYGSVSGGRSYVPPGGGPLPAGAVPRGTPVQPAGTPVIPPTYTPNGGDYSYPRMAEGGIVTRPTTALIGEAGPEAVLPLGDVTGELRGLRSDLARQPMVIAKAVRDAVLLSGR